MEISNIEALAKEKGLSLSYISTQLGLRRTYLKDVKLGRSSISDERYSQIAEILGTTPEYLRGETDVKEKPTPSGELSEDDKKLLTFFNQLPPQVQSIFANMQKLSPAQLDALEAVVRSYLSKE